MGGVVYLFTFVCVTRGPRARGQGQQGNKCTERWARTRGDCLGLFTRSWSIEVDQQSQVSTELEVASGRSKIGCHVRTRACAEIASMTGKRTMPNIEHKGGGHKDISHARSGWFLFRTGTAGTAVVFSIVSIHCSVYQDHRAMFSTFLTLNSSASRSDY